MVFFLKEKNLLYKQVLIIFFHSTTGRNFERANIFTYWLTRRKSLLLFFLHQPLVDQKFVARTNGQEYLLWDYFKYSYNDNPPKLTTTIDAYGLYRSEERRVGKEWR